MGYYIDLKRISIGKFGERLKKGFLLPGMLILRENVDENLDCLMGQGINNLEELLEVLKTKKRVEDFARQSGLAVEYLTVLRRELNGFRPKPVDLAKFSLLKAETVESLAKEGIKNTFQLFERIVTPSERERLAEQIGVEKEELMTLTSLTDLVRIRWVGAGFAILLFQAGYKSVEELSTTPFEELYGRLKRINEEEKIYKGKIGLNDMELCVRLSAELPLDIEY